MANLIKILESDLFLWGLALGALGVVGVRGYLAGRTKERPLPIGGVLVAVAAMTAVTVAGEISTIAWVGLGMIWLLALTSERSGGSPVVVALATIPGAVVVSLAATEEPWWVRAVVVVAVPLAGFLIDDFESRYGDRGLGVLFFGLAAFGVFVGVPETDWARTLFAVMLPVSFLAWPTVYVTMGKAGAYTSVALLAMFASEGGIDRPASVIGAVASLGLLILEPAFVRFTKWDGRFLGAEATGPEAAILASVPQLVIVLFTARVAAHQVSRLRAGTMVVAVVIAALLGLSWLSRHRIRVGVEKAYDD